MANARTKKTPSPTPPQTPIPEPARMRISYERLSWLVEHQAPRNPKRHDVDGVTASMNRFGYTLPVMLDETTQTVVAGHGRIEVLLALRSTGKARPARIDVAPDGDWLVPVIRGLSWSGPEEAEAYLLADNQHGRAAGYDEELLTKMLADHREYEPGVTGLGWSDEQVTTMLATLKDIGTGRDDRPGASGRESPGDFKEHDANSKAIVYCSRCGHGNPVTKS